jgi:hypothetical protein
MIQAPLVVPGSGNELSTTTPRQKRKKSAYLFRFLLLQAMRYV